MSKNFKYSFILIIFLSFFGYAQTSDEKIDTVIYPWTTGGFKGDDYYLDLLTLILDLSKEKYGDYRLVKADSAMLQTRQISEVKANRGLLNVTWTMTSKERESYLTPIRYPLLRGLGGYRICLIHVDNVEKFTVLDESSLKVLFAGQGVSWPDSLILSDNNFNLSTATGHERLFKMLAHKRFDYMPRSLHEAWNEADMFPNLVVDLTFALYYPSPYYFFVNPKNERLIKRLSYGFKQAEQDGSFQHFFDNHPVTKNTLMKAALQQRKVYKLINNHMSEETQHIMENLPELIH
jgi:hypothetical protein